MRRRRARGGDPARERRGVPEEVLPDGRVRPRRVVRGGDGELRGRGGERDVRGAADDGRDDDGGRRGGGIVGWGADGECGAHIESRGDAGDVCGEREGVEEGWIGFRVRAV